MYFYIILIGLSIDFYLDPLISDLILLFRPGKLPLV